MTIAMRQTGRLVDYLAFKENVGCTGVAVGGILIAWSAAANIIKDVAQGDA
jgi:hypothetical protein